MILIYYLKTITCVSCLLITFVRFAFIFYVIKSRNSFRLVIYTGAGCHVTITYLSLKPCDLLPKCSFIMKHYHLCAY